MAQVPQGNGSYTQKIADFVSGLGYERIPREVVERSKLLILDGLGCAIYAAELPWSRILIDTLRRTDTSTTCAIRGTRDDYERWAADPRHLDIHS